MVVVLRIEESPLIRIETDTDADFDRLADWIKANDSLHQLVRDVVNLRERRGVA